MNGKVILITGGTSGIGLKCAELFAEKGASVVLIGRDEQKGSAAQTGLREKYPTASIKFSKGDVAKIADCEKIAREVEKEFKRVDVLVNSAGVYLEKMLEEMTEEDFERVMDINVKGTYFMTKSLIPLLKKTRGSVVNVSSDAGLHGNFGCTAYCASKGAVNLFTKAAALELATFGVRVNCVCPGDVLTPLTEAQLDKGKTKDEALNELSIVYPLGRIAASEEIASVIVFLASSEASFVTGAAWSVDGGLTAV